MGIPYYVASLIRQHKNISKDCKTLLEPDVLGIDFNCFIHTYLDPEDPIESVVCALRRFTKDHAASQRTLVAFDGLVPYAKIVQQRFRRMRQPEINEAFDKHQISPGTSYMKDLEAAVRDSFPDFEVSGTGEPGEGEHKIFQWIRAMKRTDTESIGIYGLDADLVLISVAQRDLGSIRLIREKHNCSWEFSALSIQALSSVLPLDPDIFVQMSVMCFGNDFMPSIAMFSLREEGYNRAIHYFKMEDLDKAGRDERDILVKRAKITDNRVVSKDGHAMEARLGVHLMDGVLDWEKVCFAFWKTYEWTLHYFKTSQVIDWCWYYPYPEAPLMSTLMDFPRYGYDPDTQINWKFRKPPYTIDDQLAFILPSRSLKENAVYPDELYVEGADSRHIWMKKFAWEADPFISLPWNPSSKMTEITELVSKLRL